MITEKQRKNYLENEGLRCPYCNSEEITGYGSVELDAGCAWQNITCEDCEETWTDQYELTNVTD